jgi:hypothetical protein
MAVNPMIFWVLVHFEDLGAKDQQSVGPSVRAGESKYFPERRRCGTVPAFQASEGIDGLKFPALTDGLLTAGPSDLEHDD